MTDTTEIKTVHNLLNNIQKKLQAKKSKTNNFGKFNYRSCEDILEALKPLLGEGNLVITDEVIVLGPEQYQVLTDTKEETTKESSPHPQINKLIDEFCRDFKDFSKKPEDQMDLIRNHSILSDRRHLIKYLSQLKIEKETVKKEVTNRVIGPRFYIKSTATLSLNGESISATAMAREPEDKKGMDPAQCSGATSSYSRKYALGALFCIDDNKDADTEEHSNQVNHQSQVSDKDIISKIEQCDSLDNLKTVYLDLVKRYPSKQSILESTKDAMKIKLSN